VGMRFCLSVVADVSMGAVRLVLLSVAFRTRSQFRICLGHTFQCRDSITSTSVATSATDNKVVRFPFLRRAN
jgi:hypothetical protein